MVLQIGAVHREDQKILERDQRRRRATVMTTGQVAALPEHLAGFRVQTCCAEAAEVDIDPAGLNHGRGGRITIHRYSIAERLRVIAVKYFFVEPNLSSVGVHTGGEEIVAILSRCG